MSYKRVYYTIGNKDNIKKLTQFAQRLRNSVSLRRVSSDSIGFRNRVGNSIRFFIRGFVLCLLLSFLLCIWLLDEFSHFLLQRMQFLLEKFYFIISFFVWTVRFRFRLGARFWTWWGTSFVYVWDSYMYRFIRNLGIPAVNKLCLYEIIH